MALNYLVDVQKRKRLHSKEGFFAQRNNYLMRRLRKEPFLFAPKLTRGNFLKLMIPQEDNMKIREPQGLGLKLYFSLPSRNNEESCYMLYQFINIFPLMKI
jgi:hypothetical protein